MPLEVRRAVVLALRSSFDARLVSATRKSLTTPALDLLASISTEQEPAFSNP